jgi:hypothetical protein
VLKVKALVGLPPSLFQSSLSELREDADALRRDAPQP